MSNKEPLIILDENEIKKTLDIKSVIDIVEKGFKKKGLGLISLPPKMGPKLNISGAFAESMPVSVFKKDGTIEIFGVKWQSCFKSNLKKGLPYLNNLIILNEPNSGLPIAVLKGNWITAIRTAAVSAVSAKYLAPKKNKLTIGILGLGLQAYVHVLAFKSVFKKVDFFFLNHNEESFQSFKKQFPKERFSSSKDFHEVVQNSDIILTATTFPTDIEPYIFEKDLKDNVLILPLEYGTRIDPKVYKKLDEIYTDDITQYGLKGKIKHYFPKNRPNIKTEIGDLLSKNYKKNKSIKGKILVFNLGIALFDILVGKLFIDKYKATL